MSKNKTGAPPPAPATEGANAGEAPPASSPPPSTKDETQGGAAPKAPEPSPDTPVPPATERKRALRAVRDRLETELGVEPNVAAFLLGYFMARNAPLEDVVDEAKKLKSLPTAWAPITQSNYLGFRRACDFCNLPVVATGELQAAVSAASAL